MDKLRFSSSVSHISFLSNKDDDFTFKTVSLTHSFFYAFPQFLLSECNIIPLLRVSLSGDFGNSSVDFIFTQLESWIWQKISSLYPLTQFLLLVF